MFMEGYMEKFIKKIKYFGLKITSYSCLAKIFNYILPHEKITLYFIYKKNEAILKYLDDNYNYVIRKYHDYCNKDEAKNGVNIIWIFWWQGINNAPFIVKKCIESIKKYYPEYQINVIDKFNISNFLEINPIIMDKMKNRNITYTHFSDIVRMKLLCLYGGCWMDATIFITRKVKLNAPVVTLHLDEHDENNKKMISKGKWCGFFLGGTDNYIYKFVNDFFEEYWKKEELLIDYFLIDYVIELGYRNIPHIKKLIDNVPYNNIGVFELQRNLNKDYDIAYYNKLCENSSVHKLSYKEAIYEGKERNTFYKKLFIKELD